jgi:hypothetical protein
LIKKVTTSYHEPPGFGHKIFVWDYLQIKYGDTHQVILSDQTYYENEFIHFPNTTFEHNPKIRAIKEPWDCIFKTQLTMPLDRPLKNIKFDEDLVSLVKSKVMDMTSIHIRRGDLVDDDSDAYREWLNRDNDNWKQAHLNDEYYINICDRIVERNPREIFYLSTDAPLDEVKWFTDRYDVVVSDNLLLHEKERKKWGFAIDFTTPKIDIHDITDIIALSYSKRFIASNSMWSEFCSIYRKVPTIYPPNCFKIAPREGLFYIK